MSRTERQMVRLSLTMTKGRSGCQCLGKEKRNGKGSECVFISMSGFPFLFSTTMELTQQILPLASLGQDDIGKQVLRLRSGRHKKADAQHLAHPLLPKK